MGNVVTDVTGMRTKLSADVHANDGRSLIAETILGGPNCNGWLETYNGGQNFPECAGPSLEQGRELNRKRAGRCGANFWEVETPSRRRR